MTKLNLPPHLAEINPDLVRGKGKAQKISYGDGYRSELERRAAREWVLGQQPAMWMYEPLTFHLVGFKYTPDFLLVAENGNVSIIEVKGFNQNLRADRMKFRSAAESHPWARWCWLTWHADSGWAEDWHN